MELPSSRSRARRTVVLLAVGMVVLSARAVTTAGPAAGATEPATITVAAPGAGPNAKITISRTSSLANQTVIVSWKGFTPSSSARLNNADGFDNFTKNPVRVYECRGSDPVGSSACYGSPGFAGIPPTGTDPGLPAVPGFTYSGQTDPYASEPDGPANFQDTTTAADTTGTVKIQVFTRREAPSLGCDANTKCSLVVVPNYGRPQGATESLLDAPWAWARRTVIPLEFAPTLESCPFTDDLLRLEGSPAAARLLASWRFGTCDAEPPLAVDYTAIGEPQARSDTAAGLPDIGLTTQPVDAPTTKLAYAPLALTGVAIAFQVDDRDGRPIEQMHLNARLVAKLITASYRVADDENVIGNPANLFADPDFRELNPDARWPLGAPGNHPVLLTDLSDLTWTVTRWINHDTDARAFLDGEPDPYGMHVNLAYKNLPLPTSTFPVLDQAQVRNFEPLSGLDLVGRQLSIAQFPGSYIEYIDDVPYITKPPRQSPGRREIIGIVDAAQAAEFKLNTASLANAGGAFVAPSEASILATEKHMESGADGTTRQVDLANRDKAAYPLALTVNGAFPVGTANQKADAIARFVDYAVGPGQVAGSLPGQLSDGYVPLPDDLVADARAAKAEVLASTHPTTTSSTSTSTTTLPGGPGSTSYPSDPGSTPVDPGATGEGVSGPGETSSAAAAEARGVVRAEAVSANRPATKRRRASFLGIEVPLGLPGLALPALAALGVAACIAGPLVARGKRPRVPKWARAR